jgi:hypothetical protein
LVDVSKVLTASRRMHNEELQNFYSTPNIIRQIKPMRIRWAGHVALMEEERKVYKVLVEKPEGKRLFHPRKYSIASVMFV